MLVLASIGDEGLQWPHPSLLALIALAWLPLTVRTRWPLAVVGAAAAVEAAHLALHDTATVAALFPAPVATMLALYTLATRRDWRFVWPTALSCVLLLTAVAFAADRGQEREVAILVLYHCLLASAGAGLAVRGRRLRMAAMERRAVRAEQARDEEARRAVFAERVRIARELHDVLAHNLTLVNAQAGVAGYLMRSDPDAAQQALENIALHTRGALDELRVTVGLLRRAGGEAGAEEAAEALRPVPGLDRLDDLLAGFRGVGGTLHVSVVGPAGTLSPLADLAAYRILQEALTNASKHAPGAVVSVTLTWSAHQLDLLVVNGDPSPGRDVAPAPGTGHGLIGMRERALAAGGSLRAERPRAGGFVVAATIPVGTDAEGAS